jgi:hypothetical protein
MAWARKKYNITTVHLEMLFFLYSEDIFTMTRFKDYSMIMPFDRYKLERMIEDGWVRMWRSDKDHRTPLYELTTVGKQLVATVYKKLNGEQLISESAKINGLIDKTNQKARIYSIAIRKMNRDLRKKKLQERTVLVSPDE